MESSGFDGAAGPSYSVRRLGSDSRREHTTRGRFVCSGLFPLKRTLDPGFLLRDVAQGAEERALPRVRVPARIARRESSAKCGDRLARLLRVVRRRWRRQRKNSDARDPSCSACAPDKRDRRHARRAATPLPPVSVQLPRAPHLLQLFLQLSPVSTRMGEHDSVGPCCSANKKYHAQVR